MRQPQKKSQVHLERLEQVKAYIREFWEKNHYSPSTNEIAAEFKTSTSVVKYWMVEFEKSGWIEPRRPATVRNIVPVEIFKGRPVFGPRQPYIESALLVADQPNQQGITYSLPALEQIAAQSPDTLVVRDGKLFSRIAP